MEQHPIPQNVSSYQFKLVGDMTLKQFFQVAGGVLAAIIIHSLPLLNIIKWPFTILAVLVGVGLAFLPFEERPLEKWIVSFFRAIYSPTVYAWKRGSVSTKLFQDETIQQENTQTDVALKDYLAKNNQAPSAPGNLDKAEGNFLTNLLGISNALPHQTPQVEPQISPTANLVQQTTVAPISPIQPAVKIPVAIPIQVATPVHRVVTVEQKPIPSQPNPATSVSISPILAGNDMISTSQAIFSVDAAPPSPPTYPNVVVGQVVDQDRHVIEGVIMEIRDSSGRPIRALRTNKAGHFITVTQLDNGHYEIIIDKDGYEFAPVSFEATGVLIPPILVRGKRLSEFIEMPAVPVKPAYSIN